MVRAGKKKCSPQIVVFVVVAVALGRQAARDGGLLADDAEEDAALGL